MNEISHNSVMNYSAFHTILTHSLNTQKYPNVDIHIKIPHAPQN